MEVANRVKLHGVEFWPSGQIFETGPENNEPGSSFDPGSLVDDSLVGDAVFRDARRKHRLTVQNPMQVARHRLR